MACSPPYGKKRLSVPDTAWTPVIVPFDCDALVLRNKGPSKILLRTDESDADTEDDLDVAGQEVLAAPNPQRKITGVASMGVYEWRGFRFPAGMCLCVLKSTSGTATVMLTCLR